MTGLGLFYLLILGGLSYSFYRFKDEWFNKEDFQKGAKFMLGLAFVLIALIAIAVSILRYGT